MSNEETQGQMNRDTPSREEASGPEPQPGYHRPPNPGVPGYPFRLEPPRNLCEFISDVLHRVEPQASYATHIGQAAFSVVLLINAFYITDPGLRFFVVLGQIGILIMIWYSASILYSIVEQLRLQQRTHDAAVAAAAAAADDRKKSEKNEPTP
ncbi:hypothetical protein GGR54DRAFT_641281 [Hypoxylon sp. NC1633]|nr:hypothetical protein GGR54DRAFT_641281 [Hypoxylon sp. NC1633]